MLKKILILIVLLVVGIAAWLYFFKPIKEPVFLNMKIISIDKIENNNARIQVVAIFDNPNPIGATLLNTELKAFSNGVAIGNVSQTAISTINAKSKFEVLLTLNVDLLKAGLSQSISGLLENVLKKEKIIPIKFDGYCRIKTFNTIHKIPIVFEDKLKFE